MCQNLISSISLVCFMWHIMSLNGTHISTYSRVSMLHQDARIRTKKASENAFVLEALHKQGGVFK